MDVEFELHVVGGETWMVALDVHPIYMRYTLGSKTEASASART